MSLFLLLVIIVTCLDGSQAKPPHIVFIAADDLGWNDVSWHNPGIKTPNLEKLARTGIILNQSYVQPMCSPSRSAWLTGYYPYHTGMQHDVIMAYAVSGLPLNLTTLPQKLKEVGYKTHIVGKWHQGFCNKLYTPTYRGFDSFFGYYCGAEDHYTHKEHESSFYGYDLRQNTETVRNFNGTFGNTIFTEHAVNLIHSHDKNTPLFLYLPFQNVHAPLEVPKQYEDLYKHIQNRPRRIFSGMVTMLDEAIGNVTNALKESGLYDDTIILFTTDNGGQPLYAGNNWPLRGAKTTLWEGGTRGVAFVHSPMIRKTGYVYEGLIHASDWFPSILSMAGTKTREKIDGVSFWSNVIENKPSSRNSIIYNIDDIHRNGAIREGNYKLIVGKPGSLNDWYPVPRVNNVVLDIGCRYDIQGLCPEHDGTPPGETSPKPWPFDDLKLFDLSADPEERHDLSKTQLDIVRHLLAVFKQNLQTLVPGNPNIFDPKSNPAFFNGTWSYGWC